MSLGPEVRRGGNLPFGMFASRWACDPRYSTNARTLYTILVTYADTQSRNTGRGKPYRQELAAQLGVSVSTVDRTLAEMEAAGMVRIEPRVDPDNPANNEANVYHLLDFPLMYAGNGEWTDPLPTGVKAADVAKQRIEERRAAKREQGEERRGGVPKGVNPKAVKAAREAEREPAEEGGSSTHAATPGSTHAARVAAPVLPNIQSPVQNPSPEPDAPSARSAPGARSASASGSRAARAGGSAASSKTPPSPQQQNDGPAPAPREKTGKAAKTRQRGHTRQELAQARAVCDLFPPELGVSLVPVLTDAILVALAGDVPAAGRTVEQLGARIERRWNLHGYAAKYHAGTLTRPVGAAVAMVRPLKRGDRYGCANPRCEEGSDVDTGEPCRACTERIEDRRAERKATAKVSPPAAAPTPAEGGGVPAPRASLPPGDGRVRGNCADCGNPIFVIGPAVQDGLCRSCRHAMV